MERMCYDKSGIKIAHGRQSVSGTVRVGGGKVACVLWPPQEEVALWWCGHERVSGQCARGPPRSF